MRTSGNRAFVPLRGSLADIRSLPSVPRKKSAYAGAKRKAVTASALVALAAVVIVVSSIAFAPSAKQVPSPLDKVPAGTADTPRPTIFAVGYTYDESHNKLGGCAINITDKTTGAWNNSTVSSNTPGPAFGFYSVDVNNGLTGGVGPGHIINATAFKGALRGANETILTGSLGLFFYLNVTLGAGVVIPEFGSFLVPMVGMFGIMVGASLVQGKRRR